MGLQGDGGDDGGDDGDGGGDESDDMIVEMMEMMEFVSADHRITIAGATHCVVLDHWSCSKLQMKKQWTLGRQCVGRCS